MRDMSERTRVVAVFAGGVTLALLLALVIALWPSQEEEAPPGTARNSFPLTASERETIEATLAEAVGALGNYGINDGAATNALLNQYLGNETLLRDNSKTRNEAVAEARSLLSSEFTVADEAVDEFSRTRVSPGELTLPEEASRRGDSIVVEVEYALRFTVESFMPAPDGRELYPGVPLFVAAENVYDEVAIFTLEQVGETWRLASVEGMTYPGLLASSTEIPYEPNEEGTLDQ